MTKYDNAVELAEHLRRTPKTILAWAKQGIIPSIRLTERTILFDRGAVEAALSRRGSSATSEGATDAN